MKSFKPVDDCAAGIDIWRDEQCGLRSILLETGLTETVKWDGPCYPFQGKKLVDIGSFKSYFGLWFFQGALLKYPGKFLINAQDDTTKALRQWLKRCRADINSRWIKVYAQEVMANQKARREIRADCNKMLVEPKELREALKKTPKARMCFEALTKSKRREYAEQIATAQCDATKQACLEKVLPMNEAGIGLNDRHRR